MQSWLAGDPISVPETDADWELILAHYAALARVRPASSETLLPNALHNARSLTSGKALIRRQLERLPISAYPRGLAEIVTALENRPSPDWGDTPVALCRVDPNPANFLRLPEGLVSVGWENSGWGDPAFEIADLLVHPAYQPLAVVRRSWVATRYAALTKDAAAASRIAAYLAVGYVYWVVRSARTLYDVPRNLDVRLVARPADWEAAARRHYKVYLALARASLGLPSAWSV